MKISKLHFMLVFIKVCGLSAQDYSMAGSNLFDVNFNRTSQNYNPLCPIYSRSTRKKNLQNVVKSRTRIRKKNLLNVVKSRTRIIDGKIANIEDFPFVAAIIIRSTKQPSKTQHYKEDDYLKALIEKKRRVYKEIKCLKKCNATKRCINKCSNKKHYKNRTFHIKRGQKKKGQKKRATRRSNKEYISFCGGATIVGKHWLLTAAHVVAHMEEKKAVEKGKAFVFSNSANWQNNYISHRILEISIHEKYEPKIMKNDIAVIKVNTSFEGKHEKMIPFAYPSYRYVKGNTKVTAVGWGLTASRKSLNEVQLRYVELNLVPYPTCKNLYERLGSPITYNMFCAISPRKNTCTGDTGGPLIQGRTLIGIVSRFPQNSTCGKPGVQSVYAKISRFVDWLQDKMGL